ncbi:MAG TPA: biopolymer transporter ExbD [Pirellulales bacterium]|jgi:biopolymer transport protein ExbD|nr:biopolymer transporter ExbD [Pirellulales bacterium]
MSHGGGEGAEPNLTPMLDMVFQLVTFFMLVINFKAASLDLTLKLPVVGSARPVDTKGQDELLILNIDLHGKLNVYGMPKEPAAYIAGEAQASLLAARKTKPTIKMGDDLPTTVVIRADKTTPFKLLNNVIKLCQDHGYRKFALKAMNKSD